MRIRDVEKLLDSHAQLVVALARLEARMEIESEHSSTEVRDELIAAAKAEIADARKVRTEIGRPL